MLVRQSSIFLISAVVLINLSLTREIGRVTEFDGCPHLAMEDERSTPKKTKVYVLTLQGVPGASAPNQKRYDELVSNWTATCNNDFDQQQRGKLRSSKRRSDLTFQACQGEITAGIKGSGTSRAWARCLETALQDAARTETEDYIIFLEDDGMPEAPDLCYKESRMNLWKNVPNDTFVLMLGGNTFVNRVELPDKPFSYSTKSYGTYGFAVAPAKIAALRNRWLYDIDHPRYIKKNADIMTPMVSPDITWYAEAERRGERVYATEPNLIWHDRRFSNTWNKTFTKKTTIA